MNQIIPMPESLANQARRPFSIPRGLQPSARGRKARATLGEVLGGSANLNEIVAWSWRVSRNHTGKFQRRAQVSGKSWFVAEKSGDGPGRGVNSGTPLRTATVPINAVTSADDVVLLSATYIAPSGVIATACTLRATCGPATLTR